SWAGKRDQALFTLLYNTGGRVSEIANLKVGDVVLDVSPVAHLHGKGRKRRSVPLWKTTATIIRPWVRQLDQVKETDFLFP
ncbi:MAG TPA: tyrosine-type recombinase/integrase, partial [Casimicrobiaceae bacterium]|nr:tyrosine-type recombinase/integrase [Casimicrobiaceae bacterium]